MTTDPIAVLLGLAPPPPTCARCGAPAPPDALRVVSGERSAHACSPLCAEALRAHGWAVVRRGRGGDIMQQTKGAA